MMHVVLWCRGVRVTRLLLEQHNRHGKGAEHDQVPSSARVPVHYPTQRIQTA